MPLLSKDADYSALLGLSSPNRLSFTARGFRSDVPDGPVAGAPIAPGGIQPAFFASAGARVRVAAGGNALDDSTGAGATQFAVLGYGRPFGSIPSVPFILQYEDVGTAGAAASAFTLNSYSAILEAWVPSVGALGTNAPAGDMTIEADLGIGNIALIEAGQVRSTRSLIVGGSNSTLLVTRFEVRNVGAEIAQDVKLYGNLGYVNGADQDVIIDQIRTIAPGQQVTRLYDQPLSVPRSTTALSAPLVYATGRAAAGLSTALEVAISTVSVQQSQFIPVTGA